MKPTAKTIERVVAEELARSPELTEPPHGITNLVQLLVRPPRSMRFRSLVGTGGLYRRLWAVIDMQPDSKDLGYLVVYDHRCKQFGLATKPGGWVPEVRSGVVHRYQEKKGIIVGFHGDLRTTLNSR